MNKGLEVLPFRRNAGQKDTKAVRSMILESRIKRLFTNSKIKNGERTKLIMLEVKLEQYEYAKFFLHDKNMKGELSKLENEVSEIEKSLRRENFGCPMSGKHRD